MDQNEKKKNFIALMPALRDTLLQWHKEQVELEQAMNGSPKSDPPEVNVWNASPRLKSVQVVEAVMIAEEKLGISISEKELPKLIKEGGYANFQEMEQDLFPKLEKIYLESEPEKNMKEKVSI